CNTRLPAVVTVPPPIPPPPGVRQRSFCVTGSHATSIPRCPSGGVGPTAGNVFALEGGAGGVGGASGAAAAAAPAPGPAPRTPAGPAAPGPPVPPRGPKTIPIFCLPG